MPWVVVVKNTHWVEDGIDQGNVERATLFVCVLLGGLFGLPEDPLPRVLPSKYGPTCSGAVFGVDDLVRVLSLVPRSVEPRRG